MAFYQINRRVRFEEKNSQIPLYPCDLMEYTNFVPATKTFLPNTSLGEVYKLIDSFTFDISDKSKKKNFSFDQFPLIVTTQVITFLKNIENQIVININKVIRFF
ncbi:MAG: hypothetical protein HC913_21555 [Microscillaceae bacterium]|nr:hypothetical protein [Microscillaceae bacterium]